MVEAIFFTCYFWNLSKMSIVLKSDCTWVMYVKLRFALQKKGQKKHSSKSHLMVAPRSLWDLLFIFLIEYLVPVLITLLFLQFQEYSKTKIRLWVLFPGSSFCVFDSLKVDFSIFYVVILLCVFATHCKILINYVFWQLH